MMRKRKCWVVIGVGLELMDMAEAPPMELFMEDRLPLPVPPPVAPLLLASTLIMAEAAFEELAMVAAIVHR